MLRRNLLSAEQRARLFAVPDTPAAMACHYVLGPDDLALIRGKRRAGNRLGFAIQLCLLRFPGRILAPGEIPPMPMAAFVASQLGIAPALFADYAQRDETRREHVGELQNYLRLHSFRLADWRACLQAGTDTAWATDRGEPIVLAMLAHLRAARDDSRRRGVGADRSRGARPCQKASLQSSWRRAVRVGPASPQSAAAARPGDSPPVASPTSADHPTGGTLSAHSVGGSRYRPGNHRAAELPGFAA